MILTLRLQDWSDGTLIALANGMSKNIGEVAADQGALTGADHERFNKAFDEVCAELERRGLVLSDHVICPRGLNIAPATTQLQRHQWSLLMTDWNLPPGCSVSDLPDNRPDELAAEALSNEIYSQFPDTLSAEACDRLEAWITARIDEAYHEGYSQGQYDEAQAQDYRERSTPAPDLSERLNRAITEAGLDTVLASIEDIAQAKAHSVTDTQEITYWDNCAHAVEQAKKRVIAIAHEALNA